MKGSFLIWMSLVPGYVRLDPIDIEMRFLQQLRTLTWGAPASTAVERRLIVKLDFFILSFCCLMYWVNYLDRANLNNAYVSGMKEDLRFQGYELNIINTGREFRFTSHPSALISW
jgi:hypothetical protein